MGASIHARYLKVRMTVNNSALSGITLCQLNLDADPVFETIQDLDTSTVSSPPGDFRLPITQTYVKVFNVNLALQNVGAGWSWEVIDKDTTNGPRIRIYNASATLADATIDAEVKGV